MIVCPHTVVVSLLLAVSLRGLEDRGRMVQFQLFPFHASLIKAPSLIKTKVRERVFAPTLYFSHQRCVTVTVIFFKLSIHHWIHLKYDLKSQTVNLVANNQNNLRTFYLKVHITRNIFLFLKTRCIWYFLQILNNCWSNLISSFLVRCSIFCITDSTMLEKVIFTVYWTETSKNNPVEYYGNISI